MSVSPQVAITPTVTSVVAGKLILKAGQYVTLYSAYALSTVAGYLMVFDALDIPANGVVTPAVVIPSVAAELGHIASFGYAGMPPALFGIGCVLAYSTTGPFTLTVSNTAFLSGQWV